MYYKHVNNKYVHIMYYRNEYKIIQMVKFYQLISQLCIRLYNSNNNNDNDNDNNNNNITNWLYC